MRYSIHSLNTFSFFIFVVFYNRTFNLIKGDDPFIMEVVMSQLLAVAFALLAGLMMTRVFKRIGGGLPDVTSFLIAGVLIGPYVL